MAGHHPHARDLVDLALFADRVGDDPEKIIDVPLTDVLAVERRPDAADHHFSVSEAALKLKGPRIRTDMNGEMMQDMGEGYGVMNVDEGMMYVVMTDRQVIVEMRVIEIEEMMRDLPRPDPGAVPPVERLGRSRVVNGVPCTAYQVRHQGDLTVAWVSDADAELHEVYRRFADLVRKMDPQNIDPELLLAEHGFPMLMYTISAEGVTIEETIAIEKGTVPESEFQLPADYQRVSMLEMMRQQMEQIRRN